jgi:PAS domain S-box-containing protein/putative nucleotidyltransferase with HDIG domain
VTSGIKNAQGRRDSLFSDLKYSSFGQPVNNLESLNSCCQLLAAVLKFQRAKTSHFEGHPPGILIMDRRQRIIYANQGMEEITGVPLASLVGQECFKALLGTDRSCDGCMAGEAIRLKEPQTRLKHELTRAGKENWVEQGWHPLLDSTGDVEGVMEIVRDISYLREQEKTLWETGQTLEALIAASPLAIIGLDLQRKVKIWNPAAQRLFGWTAGEVVGHSNPLAPGGKRLLLQDLEQRALQGESFTDLEVRSLNKEGSAVDLSLSLAPIRDAQGRVLGLIEMVSDLTARKEAEERIRRTQDAQSATNALLSLALEEIPLEEILSRALSLILSISWLAFEARGSIFLVEKDDPSILIMKAQNSLDERIQKACAQVPFRRCLCGRAAATGEVQFKDHLDECHEIGYEGIEPHGHYCIPIKYHGSVLGVINIYVKAGHPHQEFEEEFLLGIANTLAGVIRRKRMESKLEQTSQSLRKALCGAVQAMARTVELRDPYIAGHQQRVSRLAGLIGERLGLKGERLEGLRMAGLLHDIGKLVVPAEILNKTGKLNEYEFGLIKGHTEVGYEILKGIEFPWPIADIVRQHHERLDGTGYPDGRPGEGIFLEARILAVADVVDAMASHRPYRPALGMEKAVAEISTHKGIKYDPQVVDACLEVIHNNLFTL